MLHKLAHLPLKINMAGVIPPIFASSIILFPANYCSVVLQEFQEWSWLTDS